MMNRREVVAAAIAGRPVPYTPWSFAFTLEAREKLVERWGTENIEPMLDSHLFFIGSGTGFFDDIGNDRVKDVFGVVWDRSIDKDIGVVEGCVLPEPSLKGYRFPDIDNPVFFKSAVESLAQANDKYRIYSIGFSLYERAWTLRGMENLMIDFIENPGFVDELLEAICEFNLGLLKTALRLDVDAVCFGDDWGQQIGLQMGPDTWRRFIKPNLKKMYGAVRAAGKKVFIHSCGDVDELFDELIDIGVNCFNPFQPEVMDVFKLLELYRGRLAFHGGLSTQKILPYGSVEEVRNESRKLLEAGLRGGYIFSPAHAVEGDVSVENMLAFISEARAKKGAYMPT